MILLWNTWISQTDYFFHYNAQIASKLGTEYVDINPIDQLEKEVDYIIRMHERGIGAKEYYPFTNRGVNKRKLAFKHPLIEENK